MEITLTRQAGTQVLVLCDGQPSHTFDLRSLVSATRKGPLEDPVAYGKAAYESLFSRGTAAQSMLRTMPERILLVPSDDSLDAIAWEYVYGSYGSEDSAGFLVLKCHFVRGLPVDQRIDPPVVDRGLHIVAIPSNPLDKKLAPLNIDGEWMRLKEIIQELPYAVTLERARPASLERVRQLVVGQQHRVIHFMGHGDQRETGAILCFEQGNSGLDPVTANEFLLRVRGTVFLVTLNACMSATPGATTFSNLASALVRQKTPYALGMRFNIEDDAARAFSKNFYSDLARGSSVEESVRLARLSLATSPRNWTIGVPVLYTSLKAPAGFTRSNGASTVIEHQPRLEVYALPRAEGAFQGRIDELKALGELLTADNRPRLVTIHGGGGLGKTALAREAVERFAYAWPGGVWAASLENLPNRELFVNDLAHFLGIDTREVLVRREVERQVLTELALLRTLIVLDNAETLIEAVEVNNKESLELAQFIRQLPGPSVGLLVTSRVPLGWVGEVSYELRGLAAKEGADLFMQSAPQRRNEIEETLAWDLSEKLEGHSLGIRLLGSAFNASRVALHDFLHECDNYLLQAQDKFRGLDHRHRSLNACIEMSVRYLDAATCSLLSGLWIFHAPFLPGSVSEIFDPEIKKSEQTSSPVRDRLYTLWQRGLLTHKIITVRNTVLEFYHLLPATRPYMERLLAQAYEHETLLARFGATYFQMAKTLNRELNKKSAAIIIVQQSREDLERGIAYVNGFQQTFYLLCWGGILHRLGNPSRSLQFYEQALEETQGTNRLLEAHTLNDMTLEYHATGQLQEVLRLCEQTLRIRRETGDRAGEARTLNIMADVYRMQGRPGEALEMFERALAIRREVRDRVGEARTRSNMAALYRAIGQPRQALKIYEAVLPIMRESGNRVGEATVLNGMAVVSSELGRTLQALALCEQALPLTRELGDRAGEATALNIKAALYRATGELDEALNLCDQALHIAQEIGNRLEESTALNNKAIVCKSMGKIAEALGLYEQALPIKKEIEDRVGEVTVLNNIALLYGVTGKPAEALELFGQTLPLAREIHDRLGEATALKGMAEIYGDLQKPHEALKLFEQALAIRHELGDRAGEVVTLNNMAFINETVGQLDTALQQLEQSLSIAREIGDRPAEAAILVALARHFYNYFGHQRAAKIYMKQAIALMEKHHLAQDAPGRTIADLQRMLQKIRRGE